MAERKKKKREKTGKGDDVSGSDSNKLTKEEDAIARFVRFNCPTNTTMFEGNEVYYFSGKKAVDVLVESKKYGAKAKVPKFADADAAEEFLQTLLAKGLFFRAKKLVPKKKEKALDQKGGKKSRDVSKSPSVVKPQKKKQTEEIAAAEQPTNEEEEKKEAEEEKDAEAVEEQEKKDQQQQQEEEKKKRRKVKLLFQDVQAFDPNSSDVYVWIFDPTPLWKKCVGILIVFGTIGGCLFPLWPDWLRLGIYYLSVTGIALFGLLLGVALARTILFGLIWLFSLGRHHLWLLPNLMEDCGFFESFQPTYTYEYVPGGVFAKKEKKRKKDGADDKKQNKEAEEEERDEHGGDDEKTPLLAPHIEAEEADDQKEILPSTSKEEGSVSSPSPHHEEVERKSSSESETQQQQFKREGTSGSEEDGDGQNGTDDSNSWDKLSQNSQRSSAESSDRKDAEAEKKTM